MFGVPGWRLRFGISEDGGGKIRAEFEKVWKKFDALENALPLLDSSRFG
jgi:hypothetical protein